MKGEWLVKVLWISLGGVLGANARYWLGGWIQARCGSLFPWSTLAVNVSGSFLLGLLMVLVTERYPGPHAAALRLALGVGFLGAYTTFSTFSYETLALAETGSWGRAFGNAAASVLLGLAAAVLGIRLGRLL